jgi:hypothetical protein
MLSSVSGLRDGGERRCSGPIGKGEVCKDWTRRKGALKVANHWTMGKCGWPREQCSQMASGWYRPAEDRLAWDLRGGPRVELKQGAGGCMAWLAMKGL